MIGLQSHQRGVLLPSQYFFKIGSAVKVIVIGVAFVLGCGKIWQEVHILPPGYRGSVVIVFNCTAGEAIREVDGRVEFEIPENGILLTRNQARAGLVAVSYFYRGQGCEREPIEEVSFDSSDFGVSRRESISWVERYQNQQQNVVNRAGVRYHVGDGTDRVGWLNESERQLNRAISLAESRCDRGN